MTTTDAPAPSPRAFRALLPVLRPEWRGMVGSYLVGTVSALALAALSVLTAWAVGHAVVERALPGPPWWFAVAGLVVLRTVLTWQEMDVSHSLAYRVLARMRMALFDSYARSVPGKRREHSGHAAGVAMDDIEKLEFFYAHTLAQLGASLTVLVTCLVTAFAVLPEAGAVLLAGSVLVAASALLGARATRRLGAAEQRRRSWLSVRIVDALGALREVLAYGLAARVVADTVEATARITSVARRRELLTQLVTAVREVIVTAVVIGMITTSAFALGLLSHGATSEAAEPRLSPALLPALVALALAGISAVTDATATVTQLHPLVASAQRVVDGVDRPPVVTAPDAPQPIPDGPLGLRFRDVSFSYEDRPPTVSRWSAEIAAGEHVGMAGPSGSGKSTVVALAARLWDPSSGTIELVSRDGVAAALHRIDDAELRQAVAVVDQDATLFHGTVRDNLLLGTEGTADGPTDEELSTTLHRVGAAHWIGLDDELGQNGLRLSGGQQARLCLARALVRRPRILLVDEVTANLDPDTERAVSEVIADFPGTALVASHRPQTLGRLDRRIDLGTDTATTTPG